MFDKTAQYYDLIYSFKNYEKEAQQIRDLITKMNPDARNILDVACGSAEHAKYLSKTFHVDGIDIQPEFVEIARHKVPYGTFTIADMSDFDLGIRYDAVLCLFSSIGYLKQTAQVVAALDCFRKHLAPSGVILIEPWFTPEKWKTGTLHMVTVDQPGLRICRMNISGRDGNISKLRFHYLIGRPEGVEHCTEDHDSALYTIEEMMSFFEQAGLSVQYDPEGISGRGLYIAMEEDHEFERYKHS